MLKVKIIAVDMDGFCGRDFHPEKSDLGKSGTVIAMRTEENKVFTTENFAATSVEELEELAHGGDEEISVPVQIFSVIMDDGRKLELVEFEIEFVK